MLIFDGIFWMNPFYILKGIDRINSRGRGQTPPILQEHRMVMKHEISRGVMMCHISWGTCQTAAVTDQVVTKQPSQQIAARCTQPHGVQYVCVTNGAL